LTFYTNDGTVTTGSISGLERMRITNTGNIGIATNSPSTTLHVNGSLSIGVPSGGTILISGNNNDFNLGALTFLPVIGAVGGSTITGFAGGNVGRCYICIAMELTM